jgi:hypothetical protein
MKKIIETNDAEGLDLLLGENVLILCLSYFYAGKLVGVNESYIKLENAQIVYETGPFTTMGYKDAQALPSNEWYVQKSAIESFGRGL